jgi:hypothetical protein
MERFHHKSAVPLFHWGPLGERGAGCLKIGNRRSKNLHGRIMRPPRRRMIGRQRRCQRARLAGQIRPVNRARCPRFSKFSQAESSLKGQPSIFEHDFRENKRCQEPLFCFFGRPRGRNVVSRPRRRTVRSLHDSLPNGLPRFMQRRSAFNSASVWGVLTCSIQWAGRGVGQAARSRIGGHP